MRLAVYVLVALFFGALLGQPATSARNRADKEKPFVHVPDTVSPEARKYLESLPDPTTLPASPAADDLAGWERAWKAGEADTELKVQATLKRYKPTVKERKLGGVPVLDITPQGWKDNGK